MGDLEGSFNVKKEWEKEGIWNKLDALTILLTRFYWIIFIVAIVISITSGLLIGNYVVVPK